MMKLPSRHFTPRQYGLGAWTEHIYFAYDLVAQLKPRVLVELAPIAGRVTLPVRRSNWRPVKNSGSCFRIPCRSEMA
jgi:hypothetical protein